jgi:hypothetical protein
VKSEGLRNLDVSHSPLSNLSIMQPGWVAAFIHGIFPRTKLICVINTKWIELNMIWTENGISRHCALQWGGNRWVDNTHSCERPLYRNTERRNVTKTESGQFGAKRK